MTMYKLYRNKNGLYRISFDNARKNSQFIAKIPEIIDFFSSGEQLYISAYRVDGIYLSQSELRRYECEIASHFEDGGEYCIIPGFENDSASLMPGDLMAFRSDKKFDTYKILEKMFDYFLETVIIPSNLSWDGFKESLADYMSQPADRYILNGFAEYCFTYVDSGDFAIIFDPRKQDVDYVESELKKIIELVP